MYLLKVYPPNASIIGGIYGVYLPNKGKNQPIAEQLPVKQGLKRFVDFDSLVFGWIAEQLPVKQGLKRPCIAGWSCRSGDCRTASSKTRIETLHHKSHTQQIRLYCRTASSKTRIETGFPDLFVLLFEIAEQLPVKQGLKPKRILFITDSLNNCRTASSKTRIETILENLRLQLIKNCRTASSKTRIEMQSDFMYAKDKSSIAERLPGKQGLKLVTAYFGDYCHMIAESLPIK